MQTIETPLASYQLGDGLRAPKGKIFLTGTQALVRLLLTQKQRDAAHGLKTAGFVSGYRGSPLGMVDQQLWKAKEQLCDADVHFMPAINEDLAATAVLGVQRTALDPERTVKGVFAMWYGKGPGVDRAGDALKHGHTYGSSAQGGVLVVCGDDHGCVSSSMPHQSDLALMAWSMPVLHPANVAEYLSFGLYGWALSRFSGAWVGFKAISEVVESAMTVDLDALDLNRTFDTHDLPQPEQVHVRASDLPSLELESRLTRKLDAVRAFARKHSIDQHILQGASATLGIVTVGKAHFDFLEVLRRLDISLAQLEAAGVRVYKVGLVFPLEPTRLHAFANGLTDILVIEEKAPVVERQMKELLFDAAQRPRIAGKQDVQGKTLLSALGELRPSRIMPVLADWLALRAPALDRRHLVKDFLAPTLLCNEADAVKRVPYFCAGCPHNTSTRVPEGSRALAGIGCHFMANWMDRSTDGLVQMGAEGVDWASHSRFTRETHVFQNLGDGTYFHSGLLAIRQTIASSANITYKILYNDAVAMTGGQPVDGTISVPQIARQVEAEGVRHLAVVAEDITPWLSRQGEFPKNTTFHDRRELDTVQRNLRETQGVSVLIYDQTCAAEKRRRRKKNQMPEPKERLFINAQVCEGCGDCGVQSNCLSITPLETDWGRKRAIEQSSCNKDYSCVNGFCPSFVTVHGAVLQNQSSTTDLQARAAHMAQAVQALPQPKAWDWQGAPFDLLVCGVGGTGVVTVGALITMAAHLEGKYSSVLDFMGFAQKGGAVLSFVRLAPEATWLNQVRIDTQQADALLACDLVVGASSDALHTVKAGRTVIVANTHASATAAFLREPDADLHAPQLLEKMANAAALHRLDAQEIAHTFLGDTQQSNIVMLGACWQSGLLPVSEAALMKAIELNNVAVAANKQAFALGRLAIAAPEALRTPQQVIAFHKNWNQLDGSEGLVARRVRFLTAYQNAAYAQRYAQAVEKIRRAEQALPTHAKALPLTQAVARGYAKLLAIKDEYEVARLYSDPQFKKDLQSQFASWERITFNLAPPLWPSAKPQKRQFGSYMLHVFRGLAAARGLRGTGLDVFGYTQERRMERAVLKDYEALLDEISTQLTPANVDHAVALARLPEKIRGYDHVKLQSITQARKTWADLLTRFRVAGGATN